MAEDKSKQTTDGEGQRKIPPVADRLVTYAVDLEHWPLFVDQHGEEHTFLAGQALPISRANQALTKLLYDYETKAPSNEGLIGARRVLEMLAANSGEVRELHTRAAFFEGCVYYELRPGRTVKISEGGWDFDPDPSVYFRAIKNLKPLPDPVRGGRLEDLLGWTNLKTDRDRRLYLTYVTLVGMAHLQRYILQTTGVMGSGKTTASRLIKRLMDPTANEAVSPDKRDFLQKAAHCFVLMLDNQTTLPDWFQTTLSRLVTGESDSKRRLYTDDEDHVWSLQRAILLNGINPPGENSDLQDRSLPIELNRIQAEERLGEDDFWMQFELKQPELLGGVFDALALALKYRHRVTLDRKPRLASWGDYAAAVYASRQAEAGDRSLWTEQGEIGGPELFKRDWGVVEETQQQGTLDGSIVAQAVIAFMRDRDRVELPAAKLYREIEDDVGEDLGLASDQGWPRSPRTLWREIKEVTALLQSRGIYASRGTSKRLGQPIVLSSDSCGEDDGPGGPDPGPGSPNGDSKTTQNGGGDKSSFGGDNLQSGGDNLGGKIDYPPQERPIGTPEASFGGDGGG